MLPPRPRKPLPRMPQRNNMRASLTNYRQATRKVRLVTNLVKGKPVDQALTTLAHLPKRAALPVRKLILSAVANAKNAGVDTTNLAIKDFRVDKGFVFKRYMPRARGRAAMIRKESSHLTLELGPIVEKKKRGRKIAAPTTAAVTPQP